MNSRIFDFRGAGRYIFGSGALARLGTEAALFGRKALLVLDPALSEAGLEDNIIGSLSSGGVDFSLFQDFVQEPEPSEADDAAKAAGDNGCDLVIGVGGGSAMDLAKAAAVLATNDGKAEDYIGVELVPRPGLPTIIVPTTAGTGSEVTWTSVFTNRAKKAKGGINSPYLFPNLALLDPELTLSLPPHLTASTGMDALCHAIESYTSVKANPMSDLAALEAIGLIAENLPLAVADGRNIEARENMLLGSLLAGLGLANAGVTAVHALSYPLGAVFGIPHGLANAMLLPHVMAFNSLGNPSKFADVAEVMGEDITDLNLREAANMAALSVFELMDDIGMPEGLELLDIPDDCFEELAETALALGRVMENNPRIMNLEDAVMIYEEAY
ncbi:MAG: iron-containing alcohol dehydrogenase [Thermodesulfobacteriota bacterium]|nr:iron-containing alcohol dehydrogenase [Thermodesulfobacteriota bacterium]